MTASNKENSTASVVGHTRRVYPLDTHDLTEEQIAVAFAMTSRRPDPFDDIAREVSEEKAADFHERWVLGYGHASVAEHAVVHLAVENVSRLACDTLEDNRLASYTEKSSRYQVMDSDSYHIPTELDGHDSLREEYIRACDSLFQCYFRLIDGCMAHLRRQIPQGAKERDGIYNLRLRRIATDNCRAVLPASTLTNVGVTANARTLEHAISKLLSSRLDEEQRVGLDVREQARLITPTLIKYAERNEYLANAPSIRSGLAGDARSEGERKSTGHTAPLVRLLHWSEDAEVKLVSALIYSGTSSPYEDVLRKVSDLSPEDRREYIDRCVSEMGPHDAAPREFELVDYTFEYLMDYGAYREFKRHRMQSYFPQLLTVSHGYRVPFVVEQAGLSGDFDAAIAVAGEAFWKLHEFSPVVAQYLVTHAHNRRVLSKLNLRECFHLFKLRTSEMAHFSIREPVSEALRLSFEVHPYFFRHLQLRDYPEWWPSSDRD